LALRTRGLSSEAAFVAAVRRLAIRTTLRIRPLVSVGVENRRLGRDLPCAGHRVSKEIKAAWLGWIVLVNLTGVL